MLILVLLFFGGIFCLFGRWIYGCWFNHVTIYTGIWGFSLVFFELRLIDYYPIENETWIVIIVGWLTFVLGATTNSMTKLHYAQVKSAVLFNNSDIQYRSCTDENILLKKMLWVINIISLLAALHGLYLVLKIFGNLTNLLAFGSLLYSYRVSEGLPGSIPYMSSLALSATLLAGVVTRKEGRLKFVAVLPLIIVLITEVTNMGRANLVIAGLLFSCGYFFTKKEKLHTKFKDGIFTFKRWITLFIIFFIIIAGAEMIRSARGAIETFRGSSSTLLKMRKSSFITPSIYLYFTANFGVLNQYLKGDGEFSIPGGHTFAPLYRFLNKLGLDTQVETYQVRYNTPTGANTGTYLRELHADFGLIGILLGPYLIGFVTSIFWYRYMQNNNYVDLAFLSYFFVVIGMSIFVMATRSGVLLVYLFGATGIGYILDKFKRINRYSISG
ncbi:MAG: oligosaccharide repeat unit polymerase [Ignavibacteriales bacterium]|nr:oligosaccharide repeat unit polymerase [Ignavibacteriales bacterium]